jgi:hypothetical protein
MRRLFYFWLRRLILVITLLECQIFPHSGFATVTLDERSQHIATQRREDAGLGRGQCDLPTDNVMTEVSRRWTAELAEGRHLFMKRSAFDLLESIEPLSSHLIQIYSRVSPTRMDQRHTALNGIASGPALSTEAEEQSNQSQLERLAQGLNPGDRPASRTEPLVQGHPDIDWGALQRELEDWRRAKINDWKSQCGKRPANAQELAELEALCTGLPWNDQERREGGLCYRPHIETDEERNRREAHCVAHRAGQEMEYVKRYFPELLRDRGAPAPGDLEKLTAASEEFLVLAGIKPEVAKILATYDTSGRSAGPVFAAMLAEGGIGQEEFKNFLNSMTSRDDLDRLKMLVDRARQVPVDEHGAFPRMADNDASVKSAFPALPTDTGHPHSLNGVLILGHDLFGRRFPGPSQLPDRHP